MSKHPQTISPRVIIIAYAVLFAVAWVWCALDGRSLFDQRGDFNFALGIAIALGGALAIGVASRLLARLPAFGDLSHEFRTVLGDLSTTEITTLALASGIAEEAFFRGAMQPALGLIPTSAIFGLLHIGPTRKFLWWTASALILGFALGLVAELAGNVAGAMLAHFTINYFNLHEIMKTGETNA
ncbi:MAG: CPBP family intramembrane metalloprotease [Deltaproteobacteria bacterium]|nr:CPBP family intramembrane metalloprotease [Deltaproteobacteria bacterium]